MCIIYVYRSLIVLESIASDYKSKSGYKVNEMDPYRSHEVIQEHWVQDELIPLVNTDVHGVGSWDHN